MTRSFIPTGIRIGTDVISIVKTQTSNRFRGWEINADVDFWRYNFAVDYGFWSRYFDLPTGDTHAYSNTGHYVRFGPDVNFLLKDPNRNMFFIGMRYAMAEYDEGLEFSTQSDDFGLVDHQLRNQLTSRWFELVSGIKVKIWKGLWMGYTARLKVAHKVNGDQIFQSYDIPGFGLHSASIYWGFNYQIFWRFSWKKTNALRPAE